MAPSRRFPCAQCDCIQTVSHIFIVCLCKCTQKKTDPLNNLCTLEHYCTQHIKQYSWTAEYHLLIEALKKQHMVDVVSLKDQEVSVLRMLLEDGIKDCQLYKMLTELLDLMSEADDQPVPTPLVACKLMRKLRYFSLDLLAYWFQSLVPSLFRHSLMFIF